MISLPICRWRDESRLDRHVCRSTKYLHAPNTVSTEFCAACSYADHAPPAPLPHALPCVHLGGLQKTQGAAGEPDDAPLSSWFGCAIHERCVVAGTDAARAAGVRSCERCQEYLARDPFGPGSDQMRSRADAFLAAISGYPQESYRGRGVVIAGGGERYFPSLYVTLRALRHVGCRLPVQVWYLGIQDEMPAARQALLAPLGVQCVDADEVRLRHPARKLNGWELKVFATLHSPFEEVLSLDADCYPCRAPEFLFEQKDYQSCGAIFWPDMATIDTRLKWPAFGVPNPHIPGSVESGQFVLHKGLCWQPLNLAWFYNDHSDYYYRYCYGDKHTFEVAWARCQQPYVMWQVQAQWAQVAYLHPGPDRLPLFIHRCADKFRFDRHDYITQQNYQKPVFQARLPLERECWGWMRELAQAMGRPLDLPLFPEERDEGIDALPLA